MEVSTQTSSLRIEINTHECPSWLENITITVINDTALINIYQDESFIRSVAIPYEDIELAVWIAGSEPSC